MTRAGLYTRVNIGTQRETIDNLLQGRIAFTLNYERKKKTA